MAGLRIVWGLLTRLRHQSVFHRTPGILLALGPLTLSVLLASNEASAQTDACAEGYIWREAFAGDHVCVDPETHELVAEENRNAGKNRKEGTDECQPGYVWRVAGPQDHVCVTQLARDQARRDNSLAGTRVASAVHEAKPESIIPESIAKSLPRTRGCYKNTGGKWQETACASEEYVRNNFPPPGPQYSVSSSSTLNFTTRLSFTMPIKDASIQISHLSDPSVATVTDSNPKVGSDAFSIQVNTNYFTASNGITGWVQFVLQSQPSVPDDLLCVWQVDVVLANANLYINLPYLPNIPLGYTSTCVKVPKERSVIGPGGPRKVTFVGPGTDIAEKSEVEGLVDDTQAGLGVRLVALAHVPWNFDVYAVVADDQFGLQGRWTGVSGDILGLGNRSQANFTGTKLRNVLVASACIYEQCPDARLLNTFPNYASESVQNVTGETNNLSSFYDFVDHPPKFECQVIKGPFAVPRQEWCWLDYSTGQFLLLLTTHQP